MKKFSLIIFLAFTLANARSQDAVSCYKPASVLIRPLITTADLYITPSSGGYPIGYEYAVTTSPTAPSVGIYSASGSMPVSGLASGTTYYAHVRSICGSGSSEWLSKSFRTAAINCIPTYLDSCNGAGRYSFIRLFSLAGENGTSIRKEQATCGNHYNNYTTEREVVLARGKSYAAIVGTDTANTVSMWIDNNNDGAFTYNEKLLSSYQTANSRTNNVISFFIPSTFAGGVHRMRVRLNSDDPCLVANAGEAHDYSVNIISSSPAPSYVSVGVSNTCLAGGGNTINDASNNNTGWVELVDADNNIIAAINARGNNLGKVAVSEYINEGVVRTSAGGKRYLDRNIQISVENQPVTSVTVRFYLQKHEFDALKAADPSIQSINDLSLTKTSQACGSTLGTGSVLHPTNSGTVSNGYFVEYNISSFSSFYLHSTSVLPIKLGSFKASKYQDFNLVSWNTATGKDNAGFEIEVSADGNQFERLTFVGSRSADGNSNASLAYSFKDYKVSASDKYYRLKQIGKDGNVTYSNVVVIKGGKLAAIQLGGLYPNPVRTTFNLSISSPVADNVSITINSISGNTLINKMQSIGATDNTITMDASALPAGTYFIKVTSVKTGKQVFEKFVKL